MRIAADANVLAVQFSADGSIVYGLCADNKVRGWDANGGAVRQTVAFDAGDTSPTLTPAGFATLGKDGMLKYWDLATGKVTKRVAAVGRHSRRAANPADGSTVISNSGTQIQIRLLDAAGKQKFAVPAGLGGLGALAISPDGTTVVAASYDADVRAWNSRNGELLRLIDENPVSMFDLKFSPDGKMLAAAGGDKIVYLYDAKSWKVQRKLEGHTEMISALAFSPDGTRLASGGFDVVTLKNPVKVHLWDVGGGKIVKTLDAPQRVTSLAFSPDGRSIAVATGTKSVDVWQVAG